jgi:hypothetical protein
VPATTVRHALEVIYAGRQARQLQCCDSPTWRLNPFTCGYTRVRAFKAATVPPRLADPRIWLAKMVAFRAFSMATRVITTGCLAHARREGLNVRWSAPLLLPDAPLTLSGSTTPRDRRHGSCCATGESTGLWLRPNMANRHKSTYVQIHAHALPVSLHYVLPVLFADASSTISSQTLGNPSSLPLCPCEKQV